MNQPTLLPASNNKLPCRVHLIGICGTGMAALAAGLQAQGVHVSGSDSCKQPPISDYLKDLKIDFEQGYSSKNLPADADSIVIGNAIIKDNPEAQAALESGKRCLSMPQAVREWLIQDHDAFAVVGTHGKTTTASLLSHVFSELGEDNGCLVGGIVQDLKGGVRLGKGRWFVIEGDEYDSAFFDKTPKFFKYRPHWAIFTHLEFDHADIYPDMASISRQFKQLLRQMPPTGLLFAFYDAPKVLSLLPEANCRVVTYGFDAKADCRLLSWQAAGSAGVFETEWQRQGQRQVASWQIPLVGKHNALNATAVIMAAKSLGYSNVAIQQALSRFRGVQRRMEVRGEKNGILILDDFAHHPTAIATTIEGVLHAWPGRRVWAVFGPHSFTACSQHFQQSFVQAFRGVPHVVISPAFRQSENKLDTNALAVALCSEGQDAHSPASINEILALLTKNLVAGDIVLIMSDGDFEQLHSRLLAAL